MEAITIRQTLIGMCSGFPIPQYVVDTFAMKRGLDADKEAMAYDVNSADYHLCEADLLMWLSMAPNVSQGGQSFSLSDSQRSAFRERAKSLYSKYGCDEDVQLSGTRYGYKGTRL